MAYGRKMRFCASDPSFFFTQSSYISLHYRRISIYFQISGFVDSIVSKSNIYKEKFSIQLRTNSDRYYEVLAKSNDSFRQSFIISQITCLPAQKFTKRHNIFDIMKLWKRIQKMISYQEKQLAPLKIKMEEKIFYMKATNTIAIIKLMQKMLKKRVIFDFELNLLK